MSTDNRTQQYNKRLAELEDFISSNRLVSKEAQMSLLSGEGYRDPRFIPTTGNPLIDKFGLHPLMPEGSGQILSTGQLGMKGADSISQPNIPGQYSPNDTEDTVADTIEYKSGPFFDAYGYPTEQVQTHEIVHRAAFRTNYEDYFPNSEFLKDNATTSYFSGRNGRMLAPLIHEVLAHSYEQKDKEIFARRIRERAEKYNLKNPRAVADKLIANVDVLQKDFENYLASQTNPDELAATRLDEIASDME